MNTNTFIRHYTRKILSEDRVRKRLGGISREAREALGLADTNPKELLTRLGFSLDKKLDFKSIIENFAKNEVVSAAYSDPSFPNDKTAEIYIKVLEADESDDDDSANLTSAQRWAISPYQAPRYVKATLSAAVKAGILDLVLKRVAYETWEEEEEEKFLVRIVVR